MIYTIYKLVSPCRKIYIGRTGKKPNERFQNGEGYKTNRFLYEDIQKYGWDTFKITLLEETETLQNAKTIENKYIKIFNCTSFEHGYNSIRANKEEKISIPKIKDTQLNIFQDIPDTKKNDYGRRLSTAFLLSEEILSLNGIKDFSQYDEDFMKEVQKNIMNKFAMCSIDRIEEERRTVKLIVNRINEIEVQLFASADNILKKKYGDSIYDKTRDEREGLYRPIIDKLRKASNNTFDIPKRYKIQLV